LENLTLTTRDGKSVPLAQVARFEARMEDALLKGYNREQYIAVQADVIDGVQPPDFSVQVLGKLGPIMEKLPPGYRIDLGGAMEESIKANKALAALFPAMILFVPALCALWFGVKRSEAPERAHA
jgi:multidrug efflux pump subunit AcrB